VIAASIRERSPEAALALARSCEGVADLVEFRLDEIPEDDVGRLFRSSPLRAVAACPLREEGGGFAGSRAERASRLMEAARAGAAYVDVDWRCAGDLAGLPGGVRAITSFHDFGGTPGDLDAVFRELAKLGAIPKVVTTARKLEESFAPLRALRRFGKEGIAFAMGEAGRASRALAPLFGSRITYAAPAPGKETAPGQWTASELRALHPPGGPGPKTAVFGVVGNPLAHSISPFVHGAALRASGYDAIFLRFEATTLAGFVLAFDDPVLRGLAVTAPFKMEAARVARRAAPPVVAAGAANTLVREGGGFQAYNTDGPAAADAIEHAVERPLSGQRILVLGAGGAARAIAHEVSKRGAFVLFAGRNAERVQAAADRIPGARAHALEEIFRIPHDVLVQATPVGTRDPDALPIPTEAIRPNTVVLDVVYDPPSTALLRAALDRGARPISGVEMFWRQAAAQFHLFTGADPPADLMRAAARAALRAPPEPSAS
jgi:3-dehydroquinate dehydratase/shikimate dehydrogenase